MLIVISSISLSINPLPTVVFIEKERGGQPSP